MNLSKLAFKKSIRTSIVLTEDMGNDLSSARQCLKYDLQSIGVILDRNCEGTDGLMYFVSIN